jgi:ribosomal-protein-alanine N-acetyltransferase
MAVAVAPFRLRLMTIADIPQVVAIERASLPSGWPPDAYERELRQNNLARYIVAVEDGAPSGLRPPAGHILTRLRRRLAGRPAPVPAGERIIGFLGLWYMVDEAHIVTVAVREDARRRGVGEALVAAAIELARRRAAETVTLEVRVSNTGAQALYEKYGFTRVGRRRGYYTDNGEDALIMTTPPLTDPAYLDRLDALHRQYVERRGEVPAAIEA